MKSCILTGGRLLAALSLLEAKNQQSTEGHTRQGALQHGMQHAEKTLTPEADAPQRSTAAKHGGAAARVDNSSPVNGLQATVDRSPRMRAQRRTCGAAFGGAIQCETDGLKDEGALFQGRFDLSAAAPSAAIAQINETGMPTQLKAGIESLSGMDMSDVRVHRNSDKPAQLNALAYAQGNQIHLASGQEQHLPHEAWHVVQQKQGRVAPTLQAAGVSINDDAALEHEADVMGSKSLLQMAHGDQAAAAVTLGPMAQLKAGQGPIQRYTTKPDGLSVAGELHTKSEEHRAIETAFAGHVKKVEPSTLCYWGESQMPGSGSLKEEPASSEHPDHFIAWDIDRMKHHCSLIRSVLQGLPESVGKPAFLDKVQAVQIALSAESMLETLRFLEGDLNGRDKTFSKVGAAFKDMKAEYSMVFEGLLAGAKERSLDESLLKAFHKAEFPQAMVTIDTEISRLLPGLSETRQTSYDFTRTVAMNRLANQMKGAKGVWMIGEYHVQEIQEHLGGKVDYDLVSANDFNADVKAYDESVGGSTIKTDYLGELLTLSRKLSANLDYFVHGQDKKQDMAARLAHWGRCMDVLFALEDLVAAGLGKAKVEARLPKGVTLQDLLTLVKTIHHGLDKERETTLAYDLESPDVVLPDDLYELMRDQDVLKAAKDLNVLSGLAEFGKF